MLFQNKNNMNFPLLDNPKFIALVGSFGFFQTFFEYANPVIQFLIALATLIYVSFKAYNEYNKSKNEQSKNR